MHDEIPEFDLYLELEVHELASPETIDAAWRSLSKRFHPDVALPSSGTEKMSRLNVAHEWLTDPTLREAYDSRRRLSPPSAPAERTRGGAWDSVIADAIRVLPELERVQASTLERLLRVPYAEAADLIDELEARGYISAFDGKHARAVIRRR